MNNRTLRFCWKRMMERPLYRLALVVAGLSGYVVLTTPASWQFQSSYGLAQTLLFCALVLLVFGLAMAYLDLRFQRDDDFRRSPFPLPVGRGVPSRPTSPTPSPTPPLYPEEPDRPVEAAKRKMRILHEFSEDAAESQREEIEKLRKR